MASYLNNELTGLSAGGPTRFQGTISQPGTVTVNGQPAIQSTSTNFLANPTLSSGTNTVAVVATNGNLAATTNNFQVVVPTTTALTPTYDSAGEMTANGNGQAYSWDAENRLIQITYTGGATSNFTYDAFGRRVAIVEKNSGGTVTSTKQLLWCGSDICEERDASDNVTTQFYANGQIQGGTGYYTFRDHLGSVRELINTSGTVVARYSYDPFGNATQLVSTVSSDFQYANYYAHGPSGLNLTLYRAYDPTTARWLSRDPEGEGSDATLYSYVWNKPLDLIDPFGKYGFGYQYGGEGALGLGGPVSPGGTSAGGSGSLGWGTFVDSNTGTLSEGTFASGGAFVQSPVGSAAAPAGGAPSTPGNYAMGASVSAGWSGFLTNANCPSDLSGPFDHFNITLLGVSLSFDIGTNSQGHTIVVGSAGTGTGISSSSYTTTTISVTLK